ncbi:MAG: Hsp20/alpha crystallin family protein [Desulfuromonadaceae bacterium]|nr:Hsp20/alpha crystallin family protein [Desulfuromonadaceae bacterium]
MNGKEIANREAGEMTKAEETRNQKNFIVPPVDIVEDEEGLVLVADMPGVEKEGISIDIENDILTIKGHVTEPFRGKGETILQEYGTRDYHRRFQLLEGINQERAHAEYNDGVLVLRLPKAEAAKPRQIKIESRN